MYVEALCAGKDPAAQERNEDRLVLYGGALFAVIDGVTDKSGRRYDGLAGGQLAGRLVERALRRWVDDGAHMTAPAEAIVAGITREIHDAYPRLGVAADADADPNVRFAASASIVFADAERYRSIRVGDCGLRIDGGTVHVRESRVEAIHAAVRAMAYGVLATAGLPDATRLDLARAYAVDGIGVRPEADGLDSTTHDAVLRRVRDEAPTAFPDLDPATVLDLARRGIRGSSRFRNLDEPLGFGVLDGYPVPHAHVDETWLDRNDTHTLELFSDGYYGAPASSGLVADWERHIDDVDRRDPHRVRTVLATKGASNGVRADDRTVLVLRKDPPIHDAA